MIPIPPKLRADMAKDPYYRRCARQDMFHDHECQERPLDGQLIEWEHAFVIAGERLQERWNIIPICWWGHSGPGLNKDINKYIAVCRATLPDLIKHPRVNWWQDFTYLHGKYGHLVDKINKPMSEKKPKRPIGPFSYCPKHKLSFYASCKCPLPGSKKKQQRDDEENGDGTYVDDHRK